MRNCRPFLLGKHVQHACLTLQTKGMTRAALLAVTLHLDAKEGGAKVGRKTL
jgi:hypothetical protein